MRKIATSFSCHTPPTKIWLASPGILFIPPGGLGVSPVLLTHVVTIAHRFDMKERNYFVGMGDGRAGDLRSRPESTFKVGKMRREPGQGLASIRVNDLTCSISSFRLLGLQFRLPRPKRPTPLGDFPVGLPPNHCLPRAGLRRIHGHERRRR